MWQVAFAIYHFNPVHAVYIVSYLKALALLVWSRFFGVWGGQWKKHISSSCDIPTLEFVVMKI